MAATVSAADVLFSLESEPSLGGDGAKRPGADIDGGDHKKQNTASSAQSLPPGLPLDNNLSSIIQVLMNLQKQQEIQMLGFQETIKATMLLAQNMENKVNQTISDASSRMQQVLHANHAGVSASPSGAASSIAPNAEAASHASSSGSGTTGGEKKKDGNSDKSDKLPSEIVKTLDKSVKKHEKALGKYANVLRRWAKTVQDLRVLADPDPTKYPAGVKGFTSVEAQAELDKVCSKVAESDFTFSLCIPAKTSRRDTLRLIHRFYLKETKEVDLDAFVGAKGTLKTLVDKKAFVELCKEMLSSSKEATADFESNWDLDGLPITVNRVRCRCL